MDGMLRSVQTVTRRGFVQASGVGALAVLTGEGKGQPEEKAKKEQATKFQIACMTLPYSRFPLGRALTGIKSAGYRYVAWGTTHREAEGNQVPVMAADASPAKAKELGGRCRDLGLEPVMLFSGVYPEAGNHLEVMKNRIAQAKAAGIGQLLTFGNTRGGERKRWVEHFKILGRMARENGVQIVLKPHGGLTADGVRTQELVREIEEEGVKVNYDAGNVMDYLRIDPSAVLADFAKCARDVISFCIKDHRRFPQDQDCGPGLGEIDHYRLLAPVAFRGRTMPLCCENISAPMLPAPTKPEEVDALARRAREFLELVIQGVQTRRTR